MTDTLCKCGKPNPINTQPLPEPVSEPHGVWLDVVRRNRRKPAHYRLCAECLAADYDRTVHTYILPDEDDEGGVFYAFILTNALGTLFACDGCVDCDLALNLAGLD